MQEITQIRKFEFSLEDLQKFQYQDNHAYVPSEKSSSTKDIDSRLSSQNSSSIKLQSSSTMRPDSITRPTALRCLNDNVDSTPVTSSSSQMENFAEDAPKSTKSKKTYKAVKKL